MAAVYLVLLVALGVAAIGIIAYAVLREQRERRKTKRLEMKLNHVKKMARDQRDYEEIMAYAERDAMDATDDVPGGERSDVDETFEDW